MNILLFSDDDPLDAQHIAVSDERLHHLTQVLQASVGDSLRVGAINGMTGSGQITELTAERAVLKINLDRPPPEKLPLILVLALPRPKMLRRILRSVAEFGVGELHLINSYRVEKSYWQTPALQAEAVRGYLLQGLAQARDTRLPRVLCHQRFKPFVEDIFPDIADSRLSLLAHPGDYPPCPRGLEEKTAVIIGPEGGFIPYEVEKWEQAGCTTVSLGPRILRTENALTSIIARLY